jgi:hypothetical protein
MKNKPLGIGGKIATTAIIWGFATGMLALCIPLIPITGNGTILPLAVISGVTVSTIVIWLSYSQQPVQFTEKTTKEDS